MNNRLYIFIVSFILLFLNNVIGNTIKPKDKREVFEILKLSSDGEKVKNCQQQLIKLNYFCGPCGSSGYGDDGKFGTNTERCVKYFQKRNNIKVTGVIDEETYKQLFSENAIESNYIFKINNGSQNNLVEEYNDGENVEISSTTDNNPTLTINEPIDIKLTDLIGIIDQTFNEFDENEYSKYVENFTESNPMRVDRKLCIYLKSSAISCYFNPSYKTKVLVGYSYNKSYAIGINDKKGCWICAARPGDSEKLQCSAYYYKESEKKYININDFYGNYKYNNKPDKITNI